MMRESELTMIGTGLLLPPGLLQAITLMISLWLLTWIFRRWRWQRLIGWLVAGWAVRQLGDRRVPWSLRTVLPVVIVGWLGLRMAGSVPRERQNHKRAGES